LVDAVELVDVAWLVDVVSMDGSSLDVVCAEDVVEPLPVEVPATPEDSEASSVLDLELRPDAI
jgi:hypothetical protein